MSETDSFIEEVTEEVRRDRLFALFRKYGWIAIAAIIVLVGSAAWNEYRKASEEAAAQRLGDALLSAMALSNPEARAGALAEIQAEGNPGGAAVAALVAAGAAAEAGQVAEADTRLAALAANADAPDLYRDLARLKRLTLNGNGLSDADRAATIEALSRPGGAFRTVAQEQQAIMLLGQGDKDGALAIFRELLTDSESTQDLVSRVRQLIVVLGGPLDAG